MRHLERAERLTVLTYVFGGLVLGGLFPACAFLIDSVTRDVSLFESIKQHDNPLLFMIDLGPLILGLVGLGTGCREVTSRRLQRDLTRKQLEAAERIGTYGSWELDLGKQKVVWSKGLRALLEVDPTTEPSYDAFMSFVIENDRARLSEAVARCVQGHSPNFDIEFTVRLASGKELRVHSQGAFDEPGTGKLVGITRDVTALAFARAIAMEADHERAKAEGVTAAIVTCKHEINNPLAIAIGALEGVERAPENQSRLEMADRALWRIADIVQRMDELSSKQKYEYAIYASSKHEMVQLKKATET